MCKDNVYLSVQLIGDQYFVCADDKYRLCRICMYDLYRLFKEDRTYYYC